MTKAERAVWEHVRASLADDLEVAGISGPGGYDWTWTATTRRAAAKVLEQLRTLARGKR